MPGAGVTARRPALQNGSPGGRRTHNAVLVEGFANRLAFGMVSFALPLYALQLGMSITQIGILVAAAAFARPLVKPPVGMIIDRFGTRPGYVGALGLRLLVSVALLFAVTPASLFAIRFMQGVASAAQEPAAISVLAKGRPDGVGRRFSTVYAARDLGKVSAGLIAGVVLQVTGSFSALWGLVVVLAAVPLVVVWVFVHDLPQEPGRSKAEAQIGAHAIDETFRILRSPKLRAIAALGLFGGMTASMTHGLFPVYASEVAGLEPGEIGFIYSVSIVALLAVGPLAGRIADRYGYGPLATMRGVSNAGSSLVYLAFPVFGGLLAGRVVDDAGKAAFRPTWASLISSTARQAGPRGGRTLANLDSWLSLGEAVGPVIAALLWDTAGFVWFLGTRAVLGVSVELVLGRRLRRLLGRPGS